jgi:hypothetical protein
MWKEVKRESTLTAAKKVKDLLEKRGVPSRVQPPKGPEEGSYAVLVPADKEHLIQEILKKA